MDWNSFRFIDLFAGIGGIRLGFESVGGHCVFSSEFDEDACKTYEANFGEHPSGDITKIDAKDIPDFDILLGGFPCQAFSIIGKKEGFANETCGTLFFDIERILKEKLPPAFMLENVRNLTAHDNGNTFRVIKEHLEKLGYHVYAKVLNALDYGVPQKRERIIIPEQIAMLGGITPVFGLPIEKGTIAAIVSATIGTAGTTVLGKTIVANLVKLIPGVGSVVGGVISGATAAALTAALGEAYIIAFCRKPLAGS